MANGSGSENHGPRRKSVSGPRRGGGGAADGNTPGNLGPSLGGGTENGGDGSQGGGRDGGGTELRSPADRPADAERAGFDTDLEREPAPSSRARVSVSPRSGRGGGRTKQTQSRKRTYESLTVEGGTKVMVGTFGLLSVFLGSQWNLAPEEAELAGEAFVDAIEPYAPLADFVAKYASPILFGGVMTTIVGRRMKGQGPRLSVVPARRPPTTVTGGGGGGTVSPPPPPPPSPPPPPPPPSGFKPEGVTSAVPTNDVFGV